MGGSQIRSTSNPKRSLRTFLHNTLSLGMLSLVFGHCWALGARFPSPSSQESLFREAIAEVVEPKGSAIQRCRQLSLTGSICFSAVAIPTPALQEFRLCLPGEFSRNSHPSTLDSTIGTKTCPVRYHTHSHDFLVQFLSLTFLGLSTILSNPHSAKNSSVLQLPHLRTLCTHCISSDISSFLNDTTMLALESLHLHLHARFTGNLNAGPMAQRSLAHILPRLLDLKTTERIFKSPKSFVVFEKSANLTLGRMWCLETMVVRGKGKNFTLFLMIHLRSCVIASE